MFLSSELQFLESTVTSVLEMRFRWFGAHFKAFFLIFSFFRTFWSFYRRKVVGYLEMWIDYGLKTAKWWISITQVFLWLCNCWIKWLALSSTLYCLPTMPRPEPSNRFVCQSFGVLCLSAENSFLGSRTSMDTFSPNQSFPDIYFLGFVSLWFSTRENRGVE